MQDDKGKELITVAIFRIFYSTNTHIFIGNNGTMLQISTVT